MPCRSLRNLQHRSGREIGENREGFLPPLLSLLPAKRANAIHFEVYQGALNSIRRQYCRCCDWQQILWLHLALFACIPDSSDDISSQLWKFPLIATGESVCVWMCLHPRFFYGYQLTELLVRTLFHYAKQRRKIERECGSVLKALGYYSVTAEKGGGRERE